MSRALLPIIAPCLLAAALFADAARAQAFLGWHKSGAFAWRSIEGGALQVCREDTADIPAGWPEGVTIGPGAACGDVPAQVGAVAALDYAKKELKGQKTDKKSPFGLEAKVDGKDVVVVDGPDKRHRIGEAAPGAKLLDVQWRPDGLAVAVTLEAEKKKSVLIASTSPLLVGGKAGRKLSERRFGQGQAKYKAGDWSAAGKLFEEAITADPEWAAPRYARAAAEAQGGTGRTAMIENLQWLKERGDKDAAAKKLLAQARGDAAFDAWVGEAEVRELIGLPAVASMDVLARLLERRGVWTAQGASCSRPWLTLAFKPKGAGTLTVTTRCGSKGVTKPTKPVTVPIAYKQRPNGPLELELKKPLGVEGVSFPPRAMIVFDDGSQKIELQPEGGDRVGPFEPGDARLD